MGTRPLAQCGGKRGEIIAGRQRAKDLYRRADLRGGADRPRANDLSRTGGPRHGADLARSRIPKAPPKRCSRTVRHQWTCTPGEHRGRNASATQWQDRMVSAGRGDAGAGDNELGGRGVELVQARRGATHHPDGCRAKVLGRTPRDTCPCRLSRSTAVERRLGAVEGKRTRTGFGGRGAGRHSDR